MGYHHTPPVRYEASTRNCHQDGNYVIDRRKLLRCVTTRLRLRGDYVTVLRTDTQIVYSLEEHADSRMIAWDSLQLGLFVICDKSGLAWSLAHTVRNMAPNSHTRRFISIILHAILRYEGPNL